MPVCGRRCSAAATTTTRATSPTRTSTHLDERSSIKASSGSLTAMKDSAFVPKWARLELHKAFVISYDAEAAISSHAEHVDPPVPTLRSIARPTPDDEAREGGSNRKRREREPECAA